MEKIVKYVALIALVVTWIAWGITEYIANSVNDEAIEHRVFTTPEEKHAIISKVLSEPSAEQQQRAYILDSINKMTAIEFRKNVSDVLIETRQRAKYQDSIALLNADQMFQIKEQIKRIESHQ